MTSTRIPRLLAASALAVLLLAGVGCGGDDDEASDATADTTGEAPATDAGTDTTGEAPATDVATDDPDAPTEGSPAGLLGTPCEATGTVTGPDGDVTLDGAEAAVTTDDGGSGPPAFYQVYGDGASVSLYSEWDSGAPASAVVGIGSDSYSNGPEDTLDVAADGSGATVADVELDLAGSSDSPITLSVTLTCG